MACVFIFDPCGILCILLTYISLCYADYCVISFIVIPGFSDRCAFVCFSWEEISLTELYHQICDFYNLWGTFHILVFNTLLFLLVYSHLKASLCDPGHVPIPDVLVDFSETRRSSRKKRDQSNDEWTTCKYCEMFRPPRSHHCRVCRRCIKKMDHHCPWINNCVGEQNQKYFLLFLFYAGVSCLYGIVLTASTWNIHLVGFSTPFAKVSRKIHLIIFLLMMAFYIVFVICIMHDQLRSIFSDLTAVEMAQNKEPIVPRKSKIALLTDVFGGANYFGLRTINMTSRHESKMATTMFFTKTGIRLFPSSQYLKEVTNYFAAGNGEA